MKSLPPTPPRRSDIRSFGKIGVFAPGSPLRNLSSIERAYAREAGTMGLTTATGREW